MEWTTSDRQLFKAVPSLVDFALGHWSSHLCRLPPVISSTIVLGLRIGLRSKKMEWTVNFSKRSCGVRSGSLVLSFVGCDATSVISSIFRVLSTGGITDYGESM